MDIMCLAVPARVISIKDNKAQVDLQGNLIEADITLLPDTRVGDYIIMHAGFGIQIYDEEQAMETLALINKMEEELSRQ